MYSTSAEKVYPLDGQGIWVRFSSPRFSVRLCSLFPYPVGTGAFPLRVKWQKGETDHLPPPSVEAKNSWSYNSTPPYAFRA